MTTPATGTDTSTRRAWLGRALVVSLMLNLLIVGAALGSYLTGLELWGEKRGWEHRGISGFVLTLPEPRRSELKKALDVERASLKPQWAELRAARRAVYEAVTAEPFDRDKVEAALKSFTEMDGRLREGRIRKFAEVASQMTEDERKALKAWRAERRGGWAGSRGDDDEDRDK